MHGDGMDQWLVPIQKGLLLRYYRNLFSTVLAAHVFQSGIFDSLKIQTVTDLMTPAYLCLLFAPLPHLCKFQFISPRLYRRLALSQNHSVYTGHNAPVKSVSYEWNITVQF